MSSGTGRAAARIPASRSSQIDVDERAERLRTWARRLRSAAREEASASPDPPSSAWGAESSPAVDRRLWQALAAPGPDARSRIDGISGLRWDGVGPLLERGAADAVEVWIDRELAAMHAIHRAGRILDRPEWAERLRRAVDWHLEHTGTENATHRPWSVHLFLLEGSPEAEFFASGQVHAVVVEHADGPPDACSSWILRDAARELDLAAEGAASRLP